MSVNVKYNNVKTPARVGNISKTLRRWQWVGKTTEGKNTTLKSFTLENKCGNGTNTTTNALAAHKACDK